MDQIWNILLGAAIASIVPIATLFLNQKRWRTEKKVELLRIKHDRLEAMYSDILARMPKALNENSWPSDITSKISIYGSEDVRKTYFDHIKAKERDELKMKHFYLDLCLACNKHISEVQKQIEAEF